MKNKKWLVRIVVIIFIILALVIGGFVVYKVINKDGKNIIDIFTGNEPSDENVKSEDNVNGFYVYTTVLSGMKKIHNNCSITEVKEYIAIINDEYRYYKSTCMGTFFKKSGNVTELMIQFSDEDNTYKIKYDEREFIKTPYVDFLEPGNLITNADKIFISEYKYLIKETQFDGAYYNISKPIAEGKNDFYINLESSSGTSYFTFNISKASFSYEGATTTSKKISFISLAISTVTSRLTTTIPPKIDVLSAAKAFCQALYILVSSLPTPQGFPCLQATTVGSSNSFNNSNKAP